MKEFDLEQKLAKIGTDMAESKIIDKCIFIAERFGDGGEKSAQNCGANYIYEKDGLLISYDIGPQGLKAIEVRINSAHVLEAHQAVTAEGGNVQVPNPGGIPWEVARYKTRFGDWERRVNTLYHKTNTDVSLERLDELRDRYEGI